MVGKPDHAEIALVRVQSGLTIMGAVLLMCSCSAIPQVQDRQAVITDPTDRSRAELLRTVSQALNGAKIMLADDALTQGSLLTIERSLVHDLPGGRILGRELSVPQQFELVKHGSECVLVKQPDGGRWVLVETSCVAL
jgi:hypothetical protein